MGAKLGSGHVRAGTAVARDTLFMLASVSKTVVATVLQAVENGLFELDTDVNEVLPFPVRNPDHADEPITIRHLMTHTSSIRDNWTVLTGVYVIGDAAMPLGTFLRRYLTVGGADYRRTTTAGSAQAVPTGTAMPPWRPSWSRRRPGSGSTTGARSGSSRRWA